MIAYFIRVSLLVTLQIQYDPILIRIKQCKKEGDLFIKLLDFLFFGLIAGWAALAAKKTVPQRSEGVT